MSALWQDDTELFALARTELFVAVVGDVLDKMGLKHQFLDPQLKPIDPAMVLIGRAMPVLEADFFAERTSGKNPLSSKPFGLMFEALDDLAPHEIYICAGGSHRYALWGGHCQVEQISRVDAKWADLKEVASSGCHGLPDGERARP